MSVAGLWAVFGVLCAIILISGTLLSRSGDVIAEKAGLGRSWVGIIMLATVTSLPELFSGLGAVTLVDAPDLAVGSLMGSCVFNLMLIAVLDASARHRALYTLTGQGHILSAALGIGMIAFAGFMLVLGEVWVEPSLAHVGLGAPLLIAGYFLACRMLFYYERGLLTEEAAELAELYPTQTLRMAIIHYVVAAVIVVAAAMALPVVGDRLAVAMNWNESFLGTLFIAFGTSLPEAVVTLAAMRIGAVDMALSNVLGSNLFNMLIVGLLDLFYLNGPLLTAASPVHAATAFSALLMSTLAIIGLFNKPHGQFFNVMGWISVGLIAVFLLNSLVLFYGSG